MTNKTKSKEYSTNDDEILSEIDEAMKEIDDFCNGLLKEKGKLK